MDMIRMTALEQAEALRRREIGASELLEQTIARSTEVDATLNPISIPLYERARQAARHADRKLARGNGGPLCGVPVSVKDSQFYKGVPCTNGSATLTDFVPTQSCAAIEKLEQADAIVFAKTTCPEFGLLGVTHSELYGLTSNPWNAERTSGGSSGGAAVAVATGAGALSLGGDGGGSIRIPSAFCGVVGLKPSFEAVPREPCFDSWKSLVSYGPMARKVADARAMFDVVRAPQLPSSEKPKRRWRVLVSEDLGFAPVDADVRRGFRRAVEALEASGIDVVEDHAGLDSSVKTWGITARHDTWKSLDAKNMELERLGAVTREVVEFGSRFNQRDVAGAQRERQRICAAYETLFARTDADALLTPTVGCEAFTHQLGYPAEIGDTAIELPWLDWASFLYDANLTGLPALALPVALGDEHLPVSVQLLGPMHGEHGLLDIAEHIEATVEWEHSCLHKRFD